ncbi:uncharacterized protein METZ01_LOCUS217931, partial [marine metagenome]
MSTANADGGLVQADQNIHTLAALPHDLAAYD